MKRTTRRDFLRAMSSLSGASWMATQWPALLAAGTVACDARQRQAQFANIDATLAADLAAVAAQIVPSDDSGPGADDAGVIYFIDAALGSFMSGAGTLLAQGIEALNNSSGAEERFATLDFERQRELLQAQETAPWFGAVHFLTVGGMFAMPEHGGNRDHSGWSLLGFDHRHGWTPPFGYYDRDAHGDD